MNDKQTVEEAFLKIRQNVIDEMFDGKRPVLKRLTEVSQNTLEIKCMQQAYQLGQSQQGWIDTEVDNAVREELANAIVNIVEKFLAGDIMVRDIERLGNCMPNPPQTNKDTQNS